MPSRGEETQSGVAMNTRINFFPLLHYSYCQKQREIWKNKTCQVLFLIPPLTAEDCRQESCHPAANNPGKNTLLKWPIITLLLFFSGTNFWRATTPKIDVIVGQAETFFHHSVLFGDMLPLTSTFPRGQGQTTGLYLNWTWDPAKPGTFDSLRLRRREQQPAQGGPNFPYILWVMTHWWEGWDQDKWRDDKAFQLPAGHRRFSCNPSISGSTRLVNFWAAESRWQNWRIMQV